MSATSAQADEACSAQMVQSQLALGSSKKQKSAHVSTTDDEDATIIRFFGGNIISKAQLDKIIEKTFLEREAQKEAEEAEAGPKKRAKKGSSKSTAVTPKFGKSGKPSSAASTEQKGTPLFMNGPDMFFCSNDC